MNPGSSREGEGTASVKRAATATRNLFSRAEEGEQGSSYKQGAFTFSRAPLTSSSRRSPGRLEAWAAPGSGHSSPSLAPLSPRSCFCRAFRVARKQLSQQGVPPSESLRNPSLDQPVHPTGVTASLKYLVCWTLKLGKYFSIEICGSL